MKNIFLLRFRTRRELNSTFLRFQEYYESPRFRGRIFTLKEYKKWYIKWKGKFSYYSDWSGFNIPSYVLKPFYDGKFNPLSEKEKKFLKLFEEEKGDFYIIGVFGNLRTSALKHETAHGLFYTNKNYRREVLRILRKSDLWRMKSKLKKAGYDKSFLEDEINAYVINPSTKLRMDFPDWMVEELSGLFKKYRKGKF